MFKRIVLAAPAAAFILMAFSTGAAAPQNADFYPDAGLDRSQVMGEAEALSLLTMFCFDALDDTGWVCWTAHDIPEEYAANNYEHIVWSGPVKDMKDAYRRLG